MTKKGKLLTVAAIIYAVLSIAAISVLSTMLAIGLVSADNGNDKFIEYDKTIYELYNNAVEDAMVAEIDEIYPLISIKEGKDNNAWQDGKVLMITWHKYPDSYAPNTNVVIEWGEVWVFSATEIDSWYEDNADTVEHSAELRLEQLIGLSPNSGNTHFSAFYVEPEDLVRPAYNSDIYSTAMDLSLDGESEEYTQWFNNNILDSYYGTGKYPWTRLGYTYDWANNGTEYGLSEFIVNNGAEVEVEFTLTSDGFVDWLKQDLKI